MKIFLDTNVILDWLLQRENCYFKEAKEIIYFAESKKIHIFISQGSLYTITYLLEKTLKNNFELRTIIKQLLKSIKIQSAKQTQFLKAIDNGINDLEDAFQLEIASSNSDIDYFITGNLKDFKNYTKSSLKILNPAQILDQINKIQK